MIFINRVIPILIILGVLLLSFSFVFRLNWGWAATQKEGLIKIPENFEEAKIMGKESLEVLPGILKEVWQETVGIIKKIWQKIKNFWNSYIKEPLKRLWQKISAVFTKEIEKRKEIIKEEFPKEKEELKKEIPETSKSLWQRFKELIK